MQAGMLAGRGAFGGGALLLAAHWGPSAAPLLLACVVLAVLTVVIVGVPAAAGAAPVARPFAAVREALGVVLRLSVTWRALAFAAVAAAGFEAAGAVAGPYLLDRGLSVAEVGARFELPKVVAMAVGALIGGRLCARWGAGRATFRFQAATALCVLAVAGIDAAGAGGGAATLAGLLALYLAIGAFTAASYTLLMNLTAPRLAATQFSAYMGATNGCEAWATLAVGRLLPAWGYAAALAALAAVSLLALPLVPRPDPAREGGTRAA
jgi:MFS transporter (putative signal transducer)